MIDARLEAHARSREPATETVSKIDLGVSATYG